MAENENRDTAEKGVPPKSDLAYQSLVGGLLALIVLSLGWLWFTEHRRRVSAEEAAAKVRTDANAAMANLLRDLEAGATAPVHRGDLVQRSVEFEGRRHTLVTVGEQAGKRLGFEPGDLVRVEGMQTSAPVLKSTVPAAP